jgi:hypothetical protein
MKSYGWPLRSSRAVTASLMLRKLSYRAKRLGRRPARAGTHRAHAVHLDWLQSVELRRVQAGLNKGEARNALARAVFFNRLGEIRDRSFEQQRYRASGLNLVTAAIVLWNTVWKGRRTHCAITAMVSMTACCNTCRHWAGNTPDWRLSWRSNAKRGVGKFRALQPLPKP